MQIAQFLKRLLVWNFTEGGPDNGQGTQRSTKDDRRVGLLRDFGADNATIQNYLDIVNNRSRAQVGDLDLRFFSDTPETFKSQAMLVIAERAGLVLVVDWAAGVEDMLDGFSGLLTAAGLPVLSADQRREFSAFAQTRDSERGDLVGNVFGPLAAHVEATGHTVIDLDDGSDSYHFAVVEFDIASRWFGQKIGHIKIENPSWQFKKQLLGSPYERLYRPRI